MWTQDCCDTADIATNDCGGLGCYIPQCTENCEWEPMQCWSSTGYCWCVDGNGNEIEGTSTPSWQGFPDCEEQQELGDFNFDGNINVQDIELRTPIFYASSFKVIKLLVDHGADLDIVDKYGKKMIEYQTNSHIISLIKQL